MDSHIAHAFARVPENSDTIEDLIDRCRRAPYGGDDTLAHHLKIYLRHFGPHAERSG